MKALDDILRERATENARALIIRVGRASSSFVQFENQVLLKSDFKDKQQRAMELIPFRPSTVAMGGRIKAIRRAIVRRRRQGEGAN